MEETMDNPKIKKLKDEIKKTKAKICDLNTKLRDMDKKMVILENEEIVAAVRAERLSDAELNDLMISIRKKSPAKETVQINKIQEDINHAIETE